MLKLGDPVVSELWDRVTVVDWLVLTLEVGKMEELIVTDDVVDKEMDSAGDEDLDVDSDMLADEDDVAVRDPVREAVMAVVREGEAEAVALIDGVEAGVAERERLWLWLNVEDPDPDRVAIEDMVMELLADMETEADEALEDTSVVGERLELGLEEAVEDTVVLWDSDSVTLGLDDVVSDILELEPQDTDTDWDSGRDGDTVTEGAREALLLLEKVRDSVRLPLSDLVTVRVVDSLDDTLLDPEVDLVSEAVKLGDTGDFVKDGVGVGEGMITVYDMKNTEPEPRLIMLAPICDPPAL
jgi:hypothetical protein